jgi:hypothetical protein
MIGIEAQELRVGDNILGVGTVRGRINGPDEWGEIKVTVKDDDGQLYLVKLDADAWLRIEREGSIS